MTISRQFSFINNKIGFTISLLTGANLMGEVITTHNIGPKAFEFYKKTILGSAQLINFLKPGETLGFYIDSEDPYFKFKIEMGQMGTLRTLLLPEEFEDFPTTFTGKCRVHKVYANHAPYTSVIDYNDFKVEDISNEILSRSYQTNSKIFIGDKADNSIMITKLPPTNINKKVDDFEDVSMDQFIKDHSELIATALEQVSSDVAEVEKKFQKFEFSYIGSKEVKLHCPCSLERMEDNFQRLSKNDLEEIFSDKDMVETRCDYCNTIYEVRKEAVLKTLQ